MGIVRCSSIVHVHLQQQYDSHPLCSCILTNACSRTSLIAKREKSFVGADLHAIMDDHGMLNPLVSRQLSVMSHYSVKSESGSVMITPEDAEAPFKLHKLIGRGGFGNVYLGDWEGERVAIKIIAGNTNSDAPEEQEWEARKERMAQMEAILMSAINHPNIVRTYKVRTMIQLCGYRLRFSSC